MTGQIAIVESSTRAQDEGAHVVEVQCDPGGGANVTAEHYNPPGVDSRPLPGDTVALQSSAGSGRMQTAGYVDTANQGKAQDGEIRIYARSVDGAAGAEIWIKRDGAIEITVASGGKVRITGDVEITGELKATGEVTAMSTGPGVKLSTHTHPTGVGPSGPPQPGT